MTEGMNSANKKMAHLTPETIFEQNLTFNKIWREITDNYQIPWNKLTADFDGM